MRKFVVILMLLTAAAVTAPTVQDVSTADGEAVDLLLHIPDSRVNWDMLKSLEGFRTKFYVPSDLSGPTIGTGVDVGNIGSAAVAAIFTDVVDAKVLRRIQAANGLRGDAARSWCRRAPPLTEAQAWEVSRRMYLRFRSRALQQYPWLEDAPLGVLDAVISFYMHFGNLNRLDRALRAQNVHQLAAAIAGASIHGFEDRRRVESSLVLAHTQDPEDVVKIYD